MTEPRPPEMRPDPTAQPTSPTAPAPSGPSAASGRSTPDPNAPVAPWDSSTGASGGRSGGSGRGRLLSAVLVIGAAIVGAVGWRIVSQGAESLLGSAFAGDNVWRRLPADARDDFERRLDAAAGDLESMSDAAAAKQIQARVQAGMFRLDDATLVRRLSLQTSALGKLDEATCGQFAKSSFGGTSQSDAVAVKLMEVMTEAELRDWFNVAVLAIEAEARKAPEPRTASEAETNAAFERLLSSLDEASLQKLQAGAAATSTPAEACDAARTMYNAIEVLPDADRRIIALADVSL